ncbi:hypothetical protein [Sphingobacterium multivorum]|uniref:hypothetical protein n=1 Tax=Sphingobacterium multivorum TaxID=28454 RepID=UPI0028AC3BF9|nr:hypothetical protein [Sphingobacterium multivorum]
MKIENKKHLIKLYEKLDIKEAAPGRTNVYSCESNPRHFTKTIDRNVGVTPMFIACHHCGQKSKSSFYNDHLPDEKPTHEWFVPTVEETWKYVKTKPYLVEHILKGGLELRPIKQ